MEYISIDAHKRYSFVSIESTEGKLCYEARIEHHRGAIREFLNRRLPGSPVAIETVGNWYWIVGEIEEAGMVPRLVHAYRAKMMLASTNKTDRLDARGMNRLQRCGTLPTVWIPPKQVRDERDLFRTRMILAAQRTRLKNRIHATLSKYGLGVEGSSDAFNKKGRKELEKCILLLPDHTRFSVERVLEQLDCTERQIGLLEERMKEVFSPNEEIQLLMTLPGIGLILAVVILNEIGEIGRFGSAGQFASYSGVVPRVKASGGKVRMGQLHSDVNRYLKWAYIEAGNSVAINRAAHPQWYVRQLYERVRARRGHQAAIGAVGRHLAEASYWMLKRHEEYRPPKMGSISSRKG
jgi:transposase